MVALAVQGYHDLGLTDFELLLTSLGDATCRPQYRELLVAYLEKLDLDEETRRRAEINPLRVGPSGAVAVDALVVIAESHEIPVHAADDVTADHTELTGAGR